MKTLKKLQASLSIKNNGYRIEDTDNRWEILRVSY